MNGLCWEKYFAPQLWAILSKTYLAFFNFEALFQWVVRHLSQKLLQWSNIHIRWRANLPFPARLKPQKWLYLANTFLAPPPRGVAALVSVSDDKIQITILILRRGALSRNTCKWILLGHRFAKKYFWAHFAFGNVFVSLNCNFMTS